MTKPEEYIEDHGSHFDYKTHRILQKRQSRIDEVDKAFSEYEKEMETETMTEDKYIESSAKMVALKEAKAYYKKAKNLIESISKGKKDLTPYNKSILEYYKSEINRIENEIKIIGESITDKNGWKPIESATKIKLERPSINDSIILCRVCPDMGYCDIVMGRWDSEIGENGEWCTNNDKVYKPTHWMPMPEPPEEVEQIWNQRRSK